MNLETFPSVKQNTRDIPLEDSSSKTERLDDTAEQHAILMGNLSLLKKTEEFKKNPEGYIEKVQVTLVDIQTYFTEKGSTYHENVMDVYSKYHTKDVDPLVIRREDPNLLTNLVCGNSIKMKFDPEVVGERGDKYANCALWPHGDSTKTTGLHNAFMEGRGMAGPIVMLAGYKNNGERMLVEDIDKTMLNVGNLHRQSVKILSGEINKEDLAFIIVRTSAKFFDPTKLTENEKNNPNLKEVFRAYLFDN